MSVRTLVFYALLFSLLVACMPQKAKTSPGVGKATPAVSPSGKVLPPPTSKPPQPQAPPVKSSVSAFDKLLSGKEFLLEVRNPDIIPPEQDEVLGPLADLSDPAARTAEHFLAALVQGKVLQESLDPSWASYLTTVLEAELKQAGKLTNFRLGAWEPSLGSEEKRAPFWLEGKGRAFGTIYVLHTEQGWKVSDVQGDLRKTSETYKKPEFSATQGLEKNPWRIY